jgi:hypothetical protein
MTEKTIDLDQRRGMAAQKATDLRRLLADVEANEKVLRLRQDELEAHLLAALSTNLVRSGREGAISSQSVRQPPGRTRPP